MIFFLLILGSQQSSEMVSGEKESNYLAILAMNYGTRSATELGRKAKIYGKVIYTIRQVELKGEIAKSVLKC